MSRLSRALGGARTPDASELEFAESAIRDLQPLFDKIDRALERPKFVVVPDDRVGSWERMSVSLVQICKMEQYRARVCSIRHDSAGAVRAIRALFGMAQRMGNGNGPLPMYIQSYNAKAMACAAIRRAIDDEGLDEQHLAALLAEIPAQPVADEGLARAIQVEFATCILPLLSKPDGLAMFQEVIAETDGRNAPMVGNLDYLETIREASRLSAVAVANARRSWADQDDSVPELLTHMEEGLPRRPPEDSGQWLSGFAEDTKYRMAMRLIPNSLGRRMLIACLNPEMTQQESFLGRTQIECARLQLALEVYRRRHGTLPPTLQPLVDEKILATLPIDPFSSMPLRYDAKRALIWSVGFNGKDDGGKGGQAVADGKDIAFRVPAAPLAQRP
jgi:hypothetical protein